MRFEPWASACQAAWVQACRVLHVASLHYVPHLCFLSFLGDFRLSLQGALCSAISLTPFCPAWVWVGDRDLSLRTCAYMQLLQRRESGWGLFRLSLVPLLHLVLLFLLLLLVRLRLHLCQYEAVLAAEFFKTVTSAS